MTSNYSIPSTTGRPGEGPLTYPSDGMNPASRMVMIVLATALTLGAGFLLLMLLALKDMQITF